MMMATLFIFKNYIYKLSSILLYESIVLPPQNRLGFSVVHLFACYQDYSRTDFDQTWCKQSTS